MVLRRVHCEKRSEKNMFKLKNDTMKINANLSYPINLNLKRRGCRKGHNYNIYQISPKFLVNVIFYIQPPNNIISLISFPVQAQSSS